MSECQDVSQTHKTWDECFGRFVENLTAEAATYVGSVSAPGRDRVGIYRNLLWVWHRLDADRWEKSQVQLRVGKKKATCEVDHVVSFSLWKDKLVSGLPKEVTDEDEAAALANKLGNCALLEKNFNISKGKKGLKSFLSQIHEFVEKKIRIDAWRAALAIPQPLLDPGTASVDEIREAIDSRDKEIRTELTEFIRGQKSRADVDTPASAMFVPTDSVPATERTSEGTDEGGAAGEASTLQSEAAGSPEEKEQNFPDEQAMPHAGIDIVGLRSAYREDASVKLIIDHFASRQRNQNVTEVDALVVALHRAGAPSPRSAVVRVFRCIDALGVGRFIPGRKGHATRFEWHEKSLSIRGLAAE